MTDNFTFDGSIIGILIFAALCGIVTSLLIGD